MPPFAIVTMALQQTEQHVRPTELIFVRRVPMGITKPPTTPALKTFVLVPKALQQTEQHVPPTELIFVRLVPVDITKPPTTPVLDAPRVALDSQKRQLALRHRIVFVLKTFALVPMALQQTEQHVRPTELIFVRRVPVGITRPPTTPVLKTFVLVPMALQQTEQHVRSTELIFVRRVPVGITRPPTTPVLKTFVLVPMALQQTEQHVRPTELIFVRRVTMNITKLTTPVLDAPRVALGKDKRPLVLRHRIVFVLRTIVPVPMALQQLEQHVRTTELIFVRRVTMNITKLRTRTPVQYSIVILME